MNNKLRKKIREILSEYISHSELKSIESFADDIFSDVNVDVEFTRHFEDRVNDPRNKKDIDTTELKNAFKKSRIKYGDTIKNMKDQEEAVINDTQTDINIPFVVNKDSKGNSDMVNKTIMRKKDFLSYTPKLKLEIRKIFRELLEDINVPINVGDTVLGGRFKNKKIKIKNIGKNEKGDITINDKSLLKVRTIKEDENLKESDYNVKCFNCGWKWEIEKKDNNPFLCHKCGYDNKEKKFDYKSLEDWKKTNKK